MQNRFISSLFLIFNLSCLTLSAQTTHTYTGPAVAANNWNTAGNWDTGIVPAAGDNVVINTQVIFPAQATPPAPGNLRIEDAVVLNFDLTVGDIAGTTEGVRITNTGNLKVVTGQTLTVSANTASSKFGIFMFSGATLEVEAGATINIPEAHRGISFSSNATTATIINDGTITMTGTITNDGIHSSVGSSPTINNNGIITISGQADDCIELNGGTLTNTNTLTLEAGTQNGDHAVLLTTGSTLNNSGTITLSGVNIPQRMFIDGEFNNEKGGTLDIGDGRIRNNNGTIVNDGLIKSTFPTGAAIFRTGTGTGTNTNNAFFLYADASYGFANSGITDRGIALADPTETTVSTGDDGDADDCTVDLARVSCDWYNEGNLIGTSAANGSLSFLENSVATSTAILTLLEYDGAVSITVEDICDFASLPVELSFFDVYPKENEVVLEWQTTLEINNDYFLLERSKDGRNFSILEKITGAGNSSEVLNYRTFDGAPYAGQSYYRLRQVDFDGAETLHKIQSVNIQKENEIHVFPTLVEAELNISFYENNSILKAQIFDKIGRVVHDFSFSGTTKSINIDFLPTGIYFLNLQTKEGVEAVKFWVL